jgi:hypothetical protein
LEILEAVTLFWISPVRATTTSALIRAWLGKELDISLYLVIIISERYKDVKSGEPDVMMPSAPSMTDNGNLDRHSIELSNIFEFIGIIWISHLIQLLRKCLER